MRTSLMGMREVLAIATSGSWKLHCNFFLRFCDIDMHKRMTYDWCCCFYNLSRGVALMNWWFSLIRLHRR
jgi:hypothetical protein